MKYNEICALIKNCQTFKSVLHQMEHGYEMYYIDNNHDQTATFTVIDNNFIRRLYDDQGILTRTDNGCHIGLSSIQHEWYEYVNSYQMTFERANRYMEKSHPCVRKCWTDVALYADAEGTYWLMQFEGTKTITRPYCLTTTDIRAEDWQIYTDNGTVL